MLENGAENIQLSVPIVLSSQELARRRSLCKDHGLLFGQVPENKISISIGQKLLSEVVVEDTTETLIVCGDYQFETGTSISESIWQSEDHRREEISSNVARMLNGEAEVKFLESSDWGVYSRTLCCSFRNNNTTGLEIQVNYPTTSEMDDNYEETEIYFEPLLKIRVPLTDDLDRHIACLEQCLQVISQQKLIPDIDAKTVNIFFVKNLESSDLNDVTVYQQKVKSVIDDLRNRSEQQVENQFESLFFSDLAQLINLEQIPYHENPIGKTEYPGWDLDEYEKRIAAIRCLVRETTEGKLVILLASPSFVNNVDYSGDYLHYKIWESWQEEAAAEPDGQRSAALQQINRNGTYMWGYVEVLANGDKALMITNPAPKDELDSDDSNLSIVQLIAKEEVSINTPISEEKMEELKSLKPLYHFGAVIDGINSQLTAERARVDFLQIHIEQTARELSKFITPRNVKAYRNLAYRYYINRTIENESPLAVRVKEIENIVSSAKLNALKKEE
jgi:hypothetical protein